MLRHTFAAAIASPATLVARFYVRFATVPGVVTTLFDTETATNHGGVEYHTSGEIRTRIGATDGSSGIAVTTGRWYRIDFKYVTGATCTADLQVDGVAVSQQTAAGASATITGFDIGPLVNNPTCDFFVDDVLVSGTSGDYPIGEGGIVGLYPNADRTNTAANPSDTNFGHFYSAVGDFGKGSGGGTDLAAQNSESTSWQSLANPLSTSVATNFVSDRLGISSEHLVWNHALLPSGAAVVNGVMLVWTTHSASATGNAQTMSLMDGVTGDSSTTSGSLDLSESTITVPVVVFPTNTGGGAWTVAKVNTANFRWGDSIDVNPDVFCDGVCLEVDWSAVPPGTQYIHIEPNLAATQAGRV